MEKKSHETINWLKSRNELGGKSLTEFVDEAIKEKLATTQTKIFGEGLGKYGYVDAVEKLKKFDGMEARLKKAETLKGKVNELNVKVNELDAKIVAADYKHEGYMEAIAQGLITIRKSDDTGVRYTIDMTELHKVLKETQQENKEMKSRKRTRKKILKK